MIEAAQNVIDDAIRRRVCPAATAEVGTSAGPTWSCAAGALTFDPEAVRADISTPFDLASLTKVIATTTLVMDLLAARRLCLDELVADGFDGWRGRERASVTVRDLLEHAAGLPARLDGETPEGREAFERAICATRLEYAPRTRSTYSDLGFILLGFLVADRGGASLAEQFDAMTARIFGAAPPAADLDGAAASAPRDLAFALSAEARRRAAPTQPLGDDARCGRALSGEVHDSYAAALGGAAGHAGLFGTAPSVGAFGRAVLRAARGDRSGGFSPDLVTAFLRKSAVPGSSRAMGWDTMLPTSSCGARMSTSAFGHTGFTGTSLWIDPERDRYFVLLTNRACGGGTLDDMRAVRRAFHDALGVR